MSLQIPKQVEFASLSLIPESIFDIYYYLEKKFQNKKNWKDLTEYDLWYELCLCILASNVNYDQALSAASHLHNKKLLDRHTILENLDYAQNRIAYELSLPVFLPKKKDGQLRKYRFPNIRAKNIIKSSVNLSSTTSLVKLLKNSDSENGVRNFLVENISGMAHKEASHFLRDVGFSNSLAIIDTHILNFLKELTIIPTNTKISNVRNYFELETIMQNLANHYDLKLSILDNAIWHYMKITHR